MFRNNKNLVLSIILLGIIALFFWLGSRYPALNEKALMGGDTTTTAIGFDQWLETASDHPVWLKIVINTGNWLYTNRQGMTFGLLFAAALMLIFSLLQKKSFDNIFANSFLGMVIGAPLGVCVNCAAPIAAGVHRAGGRVETAIAMMVSSPTMNIIVLTMLFSLFPLYMVVIKIALTLVFILAIVPLSVQFVIKKGHRNLATDSQLQVKANDRAASLLLTPSDSREQQTWGRSIGWVAGNFLRNLWTLVKLTLPLMLLAGLLGNIVITLVPWEILSAINPFTYFYETVAIMIGIAMAGVFLPVPMAFDVIIVAILVAAGIPPRYTMILLFCLGIFSIYPWLLIKQSVSGKLAALLFIVLVMLGITAGISGHYYARWDMNRKIPQIIRLLEESPDSRVSEFRLDPPQRQNASIATTEKVLNAIAIDTTAPVTITQLPFTNRKGSGDKAFERLEGQALGIQAPNSYTVYDHYPPFAHGPGISSGDIDRDGWPDLLIAFKGKLTLYKNDSGSRFIPLFQDTTDPTRHPFSAAALVDLNNDAWPDIFYTVYNHGNFIRYNHHGSFDSSKRVLTPNHDKAVLTVAPSFGDVDLDGDLDIFLGNWTLGVLVSIRNSLKASQNALLLNRGEHFEMVMMPGMIGETLSTMITDFNNDHWPDLIVGNDFKPPDVFYIGDGNGSFRVVNRSQGLIERSAQTTMSIATADIDNDLLPEIYVAAISREGLAAEHQRSVDPELCEEIEDPAYKDFCQKTLQHYVRILSAASDLDMSLCPPGWEHDCIASYIYRIANKKRPREHTEDLCELLPGSWESLKWLCQYNREDSIFYNPSIAEEAIPFLPERNILLKADNEGRLADQADKFGLVSGGWSWNAKFADLDNDEWQDLYLVNGFFLQKRWDQKHFYRSINGKHFEDQTEAAGLQSFLPIHAYTYVDYDHDGDLDIIAAPAIGPILVYRNTNTTGQAIAFELQDELGNFYGIGSKVIIRYNKGQRHQMREIQAGGGFKSFDAPVAWFGLGTYEHIDRVEIIWPGGDITIVDQPLKAGSRYVITRSRSEL